MRDLEHALLGLEKMHKATLKAKPVPPVTTEKKQRSIGPVFKGDSYKRNNRILKMTTMKFVLFSPN